MSGSQQAGPPGQVPQDPGWWPAFRGSWRMLIPFLSVRDMRRSQSSETPGVTGLRRIFVAFAFALLLFLYVLIVIFPLGQPAESDGTAVGIGVLLGGIVTVAAGITLRRRSLDCQETAGLVSSYVQLMFLRIAVAQAPALFGFVGAFLVGGIWPYLLGLGFSAVGYTAAAPTASDIRRHDQELVAGGCPHSLRTGLYSQHPPSSP